MRQEEKRRQSLQDVLIEHALQACLGPEEGWERQVCTDMIMSFASFGGQHIKLHCQLFEPPPEEPDLRSSTSSAKQAKHTIVMDVFW